MLYFFDNMTIFHAYGHEQVYVFDGCLLQWCVYGCDVEPIASCDAILKAKAASEAIEKFIRGSWFIVLNLFAFFILAKLRLESQ